MSPERHPHAESESNVQEHWYRVVYMKISELDKKRLPGALILLTLTTIVLLLTVAIGRSVFQGGRFAETLLDRQQCRLPCWHGITPGSSTEEETVEYLKASTVVAPASVRVVHEYVSWNSRNKLETGYAKIQRGTVQSIELLLHPSISLNRVAERLGPPDTVYVTTLRDLTIHFYYVDEGLELVYRQEDWSLRDEDLDRTLSYDMDIESVVLVAPENLHSWLDREKVGKPWQGELPIREYCGPESCLTILP